MVKIVEIVKIDKFRVSWGNEWKKLGLGKIAF